MSNDNKKAMSPEQALRATDMLMNPKKTPVVTPVEKEIPVDTEEMVEESTVRKQKTKKGQSHKELFVQEVGMTARYGKAVYIRKEFHERIQKIVQIIGANEVTLYSYIDNVLTHHFNTYQQEITKEYDDSIGRIF